MQVTRTTLPLACWCIRHGWLTWMAVGHVVGVLTRCVLGSRPFAVEHALTFHHPELKYGVDPAAAQRLFRGAPRAITKLN